MDNKNLIGGIAQKESRIDKCYFKTFPGVIQLAQLGLSTICIIIVSSWFRFILGIIIVMSLICISMHAFRLKKKFKKWILIEFFATGVMAGLFFIGMVTQFLFLHFIGGIFCSVGCLAYAIGTYLLYRLQRNEVLEGSGLTQIVENNFNRSIQSISVLQ